MEAETPEIRSPSFEPNWDVVTEWLQAAQRLPRSSRYPRLLVRSTQNAPVDSIGTSASCRALRRVMHSYDTQLISMR